MERYALLWLVAAVALVVLALWRGLLTSISGDLHIYTPVNALFAAGFVFVIVLLLHFSMVISRLSEQNKILAQRLALLDRARRSSSAGRTGAAGAAEHPRGRQALRLAVVIVAYNSEATIARSRAICRRPSRTATRSSSLTTLRATGRCERARERGTRRARERRRISALARAAGVGATATDAPLLLFLNPDLRLAPHAIERLRAVADEQPLWAAWQPAVMLPDGRINSAGGAVHFLGLSWAGQCEQQAEALPADPYETAFASGAALVVRRSAWDELDGFDDSYFLYGEDLDLGLRLWLAGKRVGVEPRARVVHAYEFDKGTQKWFLLERNRWRTLIAVYPASLLALLAPALLAAELGLIVDRGARRLAAGEAARRPRDRRRPARRAAAAPSRAGRTRRSRRGRLRLS